MTLFSKTWGTLFSPDRVYRFRLWCRWSDAAPAVFCMLNPSTDDEEAPTTRRCLDFAVEWGCGGFEVVNLFAIVSSNPRVLRVHHDPIGPFNNKHILQAARRASILVFGWGAFPEARERAIAVTRLLSDNGCPKPMCLGVNGDGSPKHPLPLRKTTKTIVWAAPTDLKGARP